VSENSRRVVQSQLERIAYLRATGPNPFDYWVWADSTEAVLLQAFGSDSPEALRFLEAVSEPGRTNDQRGIADNMTLGIHGEWGIIARLTRAEGALREIAGEL
jgi:hypothetical protein